VVKYSLSLLSICVLSFIIVFSCSNEQDDAPTPDAIVKKYTLAVTAGEGGTVSSSGGTYSQGTQVSITATPSSGFTFSQWSNGSTTNPITVTLNSNTNLSATFTAIINTYTLTVSAAEGGTVSTEGGTYNEGTEVTIIATPSEGYRFTGWEGNTSTEESLTITLNSDQTLQALFELIPIYTLTVTTSEGGTVSTEGGEYEEGTEVTITATPNEGYRFDGWEGYQSTDTTLVLTINSNIIINPFFVNEAIPFNWTTNQFWGQEVDFDFDLHFANSIDNEVIENTKTVLSYLTKYFPRYGPVEIWFAGNNESVDDFATKYAEHRKARNQFFWGDYEQILQRAKNYFSELSNSTNAGIYGDRDNGFHLMLVAPRLIECENKDFDCFVFTAFHEYTHIVQGSNNSALRYDLETAPNGEDYQKNSGPVFFKEGSAQYYGEYIPRKLNYDGKANILSAQSSSLRQRMEHYMNGIQSSIIASSCNNLSIWDINYDSSSTCNPYYFGLWGTAYLLNKVNDQDAFWKTLWPNVDQMGWDGAFEYTFGISMDEFYEEFWEFLELPIEQQLEIIPDI